VTDTVLDIRNLSVALPADADRPLALDDVSLALRRREILCIVGESGSGKSMLSRAIMGLLPPRVRAVQGEIRFNGEDLLAASPERVRLARGREISMIFQEPMTALNPLMTIGAQIDEAIRIHMPMDARSRASRVLEMLASVHLPEPEAIRRSYPHQLSGGQRQRAMIAMALSLGPSILIADEPTTALDVTTQAQILALIKEVQAARDMSVIFITHDFGVVADIADRVAVMQLGKVVEAATAREVLSHPRHPYTQSLVAAVPRMAPRAMANGSQAAVVLAANRLQKTYAARRSIFRRKGRVVHAVKDASFAVRRGETLGLVGESGSGKSTLARCMCRLLRADSGEAMLDGTDIQALSRKQMRPMHKRVQMVFQDPYGSLNPRLTVASLIAEGPIVHGMARHDALRKARTLLELVGLDARAGERYPHEFSGGQRQRIALARALAVDPEVLIADEPVSALDVSVQAQILKLLADTRERLGLTMLFVTHDLRVASQVCDTVAVMRNGEIVESGPTESVFTSPRHPYTVALMAAVPGQAWHREAAAPEVSST
jgi:peptide/nickel transport system ATP-binding protein